MSNNGRPRPCEFKWFLNSPSSHDYNLHNSSDFHMLFTDFLRDLSSTSIAGHLRFPESRATGAVSATAGPHTRVAATLGAQNGEALKGIGPNAKNILFDIIILNLDDKVSNYSLIITLFNQL